MEIFEEILKKDLHQFLQSMQEVDKHMPECPDVEDKWEEIATKSIYSVFAIGSSPLSGKNRMIFEKYEEDNKPLAQPS